LNPRTGVSAVDGVFVIDKPEGLTSHDVVSRLRRIARTRRVGHLGTLDPIATGVLPLVVGRATRLAQFYTRSDKTYEGRIRFGIATDTYDRAGTPAGPEIPPAFSREELERQLDRFRGEFLQTPPPVSAKKVEGVRAYELARKHIPVTLEPVPVIIYELDLLSFELPYAVLRIRCSGGTYMRSLAHDLGEALGCGAHLESLRRTAAGEFSIGQAHTLEDLAQLAAEDRLVEALIPAAQVLPSFPAVYVESLLIGQIRQGRNFPVSPFRTGSTGTRYVKAISREGELIAIGEAKLPNLYHPIIVF
jgi:tRNA pseudouridine55 synthase